MSLGNATEEDLKLHGSGSGKTNRNGDRDNYPTLQNLNEYDCGCNEPCSALNTQ